MVKLRHLLYGAAVFAAAVVASAPATASCVTCTSTQRCVIGSDGAYCGIWIVDGSTWCNFYDACTVGLLSPEDLSPSGTFLALASVERDGRRVVPCNGFVVAHRAGGEAPGEIRV